jgi:hypothetical protein
MQQPSAQGIASLYRGNPQPLQQQIQKEQQAKPGLPPDLQKMLALQIVTNEKDSAMAQKAMQQLQQMGAQGGPGGQPPTVMQTLEQQAQQQMQAQQAPQGMPGEAAPAPQGAGIDQLPADFQMAGGGIVAFNGEKRSDVPEYETAYDRYTRKVREEKEAAAGDAPLDEQAAKDRATAKGIWDMIRGGSESAGRAIADIATLAPRRLAGAYDTAVVRPMRAAGVNAAYLSPKLTPEGASPDSMTPFTDIARARDSRTSTRADEVRSADNRAALNRADAAMRAAPAEAAPPARDLQQLAAQKARAAQKAATPAAAPTTPAVAPEGSTQAAYDKYMNKALTADRDAERAAEEARYAAAGKQDLSQYDRLIAELDKRKAQFDAPKAGFDRLSEYLGKVAEGGRGRKWYEAGAQGAAGLAALDKERKTQQFELTKQGVEIAQKKLDAERTFSLDKYKAGQEGAKRVDDAAKDAAKEFGLDARNEKTLANDIKAQLLRNQGALAAASVNAGRATTLTPNQRAEIANKAADNVQAELAKNPQAMTALRKNPALRQQMVADETERLMAAAEGRTIRTAPGASGPGGNMSGWGKAQVVK